MTIANKVFFLIVLFIQVYLLSIFSFISSIEEVVIVFLYAMFSFYRPLWALSLFFAILPLFGFEYIQVNNSYLIIFTSATLLGIYTNLLLQLPVRLKRFLVKIRFTNITLILIFFYVVSLFFGLIGQPIYSLYNDIFILNNPKILIELFNISADSDLYPLKSSLMIVQSILLGLYVFGIVKPSNQVRILHHLILALVLGLIFSFFIAFFSYFNIIPIYLLSLDISLYSQYLIITLPLLPVILLLHKMNVFYFILITSLTIVGGVTLILSMQLTALITYPFIMLTIWVMIYFIIIRIRHRQEALSHFLKNNWIKIILSFTLTSLITIFFAFNIKTFYQNDNFFTSKTVNLYQIKQKERANTWSLSTKIFLLNPIYGTGFNSFQWKANKLKEPYSTSDSLDNLYLETAIGLGLMGLIFFVSFIALIFYKLLNKEFSKKIISIEISILGLIVLTSLFSIFIYANVASIFDFYPILIIFWLIVFIGLSLTHSYAILRTQRYRARKFFQYMSYIILYFLIIHILNFSVIKEYFSTLVSETFFSYLLIVMVIGIVSSFIMHSKIIFYSNDDKLFIDDYGSKKSHAVHISDIPRAGGIGIYLTNIFLIFNPIGWKLLLISLPIFIIGLMDDIKSITPRKRLLFQTISAIFSVLILNSIVYSIGFGVMLPLWLSVLISVFAIVGVTNALNIIDGFNGLSSGGALMMFLSLALVSLIFNDMTLFEIISINIIALIGFLLLNFPKGKIFLGDSGAYFIGFSLATISLIITYTHQEISIFYPLALLIYPIWEVIFSIYRRKIIKKVKSTHADKLHLHQLIYTRITRNNPKTTLYIWLRIAPFIMLSTFFYDNDIALLLIILIFILSYNFLYKKIIKGLMTIK